MNTFKTTQAACGLQFGLFIGLNGLASTEAIAGSGFDYVVFDAEHTPLTLDSLHAQLTALGRDGPQAVVRVASHDNAGIKHCLDLDVRTLMFPNVTSRAQAEALVRATRYAPDGYRGVAGTTRASHWGRNKRYLHEANSGISVWAQVESRAGIAAVEEVAGTAGVDLVYFGPNDMAADFGEVGQSGGPANVERIMRAAASVRRLGKAAGILCAQADFERYCNAGISNFCFASDASLLVRAADELAAKYAPWRGKTAAKAAST
jgi:4-hydroxy-2-oxoheptanedioate aldolase